jgi:hypothetical protein
MNVRYRNYPRQWRLRVIYLRIEYLLYHVFCVVCLPVLRCLATVVCAVSASVLRCLLVLRCLSCAVYLALSVLWFLHILRLLDAYLALSVSLRCLCPCAVGLALSAYIRYLALSTSYSSYLALSVMRCLILVST